MIAMQMEWVDRITAIDRDAWNALVGPGTPFLEHGFLHALEASGAVGGDSGWYPQFLVARRPADAPDIVTHTSPDTAPTHLLGALPLYIKTHSMGEFVFDFAWADAAHRAGIHYYPKAVVAAPLTPIQGRRILVDPALPAPNALAVQRALIQQAVAFCQQAGLSSLHFNFVHPDERAVLESCGLPIRVGMQFHWHNRKSDDDPALYPDFDTFLARFSSKKRANIRRERRKLADAGVTTRVLTAGEITHDHLDLAFDYYLNTIEKLPWGHQYLTREFFHQLGDLLPERLHLVLAEHAHKPFAGAFNLWKDDALYGRYWGCLQDIEFAHFEACLYRPLQWCIAHDIRVFQPGAQGPHKYDRGFDPTPTYSAHWIADPRLQRAVEDFIQHERLDMEAQIARMRAESPLR